MRSCFFVLFLFSAFFLNAFEQDLGTVVPGKVYDLEIDLSSLKAKTSDYKFIKDCDCIKDIQISDKHLLAKIEIENYLGFFPKEIYLYNSNNTKDRTTISIVGEIKEVLPTIQYFYSSNCKTCEKVNEYLKGYCSENNLYLDKHDIKEERNLSNLLSFFDADAKIATNVVVFSQENGLCILNGKDEIYRELSQQKPTISRNFDTSKSHKDIFNYNFNVLLVISAGFIDGINPCAFATIIFFVALLSLNKVSNKRIFKIGLMFILGIFSTYFFIGIGLIKAITIIEEFSFLKYLLNSIILISLFVIILINVLDIVRFKNGKRIINQLSNNMKKRIHTILRKSLNSNYLVIGVFILGVQVALLESVCTGQIYLPLIKIILKDNIFDFQALSLLLVYNLLFIFPLILVFALVLLGKKSNFIKRISEKYFIYTKFLMIILFSIFAFIILKTAF